MRKFHFFSFRFIAIGKYATTRNASEIGVNHAIALDRHDFVERVETFEGFEARERDRIRQLAERTEQATLDDLVNSRRVDDSAGTEDA